jgi:hypothetical protein
MALPIERWAREAVRREAKGNYMPVADTRVLSDVAELAMLHMHSWKRRQTDIIDAGVPIAMPEGTYGGLLAYPPAQTITTTSLSGTVNLWSNLVYTPIPQNAVLAPQAYRIAVTAKITTAATPANFGLNPLINSAGTWTTGGTAVSGGSTLGASTNVALTASITNAFYYVIGDLTIRTAGTSGTAVAMFESASTQNTAAGLAGPAAAAAAFNLLFGGTAVTADFQTTAQSLQFGAVHTVTTITHNVEQIHFMDWN